MAPPDGHGGPKNQIFVFVDGPHAPAALPLRRRAVDEPPPCTGGGFPNAPMQRGSAGVPCKAAPIDAKEGTDEAGQQRTVGARTAAQGQKRRRPQNGADEKP